MSGKYLSMSSKSLKGAMNNIKIHWTHKFRIKRLFVDGFSEHELSIMYNLPFSYIKGLTRGLKQNERV